MAPDQDNDAVDPYKMTGKAFGQMIEQERRARGLDVSEVTARAGLSIPNWNKIEKGEIKNPRLATRRKMMEVVGLRPAVSLEEGPVLDEREVLDQVVRNLADLAREVRALRTAVERLEARPAPAGASARKSGAARPSRS